MQISIFIYSIHSIVVESITYIITYKSVLFINIRESETILNFYELLRT